MELSTPVILILTMLIQFCTFSSDRITSSLLFTFLSNQTGHHFHCGRVIVGKEQALPLIQCLNGSLIQRKIKHIDILCIRSLCVDFGMTTMPLWIRKRRAACAAVFPCFSPISANTGLEKKSFRPSAKGPQDSCCTPYLVIYSWAVFCCWNTWVSTWLTAGLTSTNRQRSTRRSG